ncbi:MAG: ferrous iron transport protein A [Calditrichaeota bacterium]|nr:ferrous iron transport protein A [Calditrichota bacterium]
MQSGGFQNQPLMKLTLLFTLLLLAGFWATNFALYFARMDITPQSVEDYYLGSQEQFKMPRTYQSMLEVTHSHLPMMAFVVLLLTHLLIFAPYSFRTKAAFIASGFVFSLLNESAGWLVRFVSPNFVLLKVAGFLGFQGILGFLLVALAMFLIKTKRGEDSDSNNYSRTDSTGSLDVNKSVPLTRLKPGEEGTVVSIQNNGSNSSDLMEMGLTPGTQIKLVKLAPLGDPMELDVRGYHLSVRRSEAKNILIERGLPSN